MQKFIAFIIIFLINPSFRVLICSHLLIQFKGDTLITQLTIGIVIIIYYVLAQSNF